MEQILSSRRPRRGASAGQASKQCQDEALKLHEPRIRSCPASLLPNVKSSGNTVFSYLRTWQTHSTRPLCEARIRRGSSSNVSAHYRSPYPEAATPPLRTAGGVTCHTCPGSSCRLGDISIRPQELAAQVRRLGERWSLTMESSSLGNSTGKPEGAQRGMGKPEQELTMTLH